MKSLNAWLAYAEAVHPSDIELGLDRIRAVADGAGLLNPAPLNLIVAGTNGKGSTSVFAEHLLLHDGMAVGTTLSPHLESFNERVRVGGVPVDNRELTAGFEAIDRALDGVRLTYFEYAILVAFWVFKERGVDVAVLEVGLGGRLDAVNIVDADVAVVTNIGFDHQDYLGDTLELIGAEKAAVARPGKPLLLGDRDMPHSVYDHARRIGAICEQVGADFDLRRAAAGEAWRYRSADREFELRAPPRVLPNNAAAAIRAVELLTGGPSTAAVTHAAGSAGLPGRQEVVAFRDRTVVLDVAHNEAAARALGTSLADRPIAVALIGTLRDKDTAALAACLASETAAWIGVATHGPRGLSEVDAANRLAGLPVTAAREDVGEALDLACEVTEPGDTILVYGSFDIVANARRVLDADGLSSRAPGGLLAPHRA